MVTRLHICLFLCPRCLGSITRCLIRSRLAPSTTADRVDAQAAFTNLRGGGGMVKLFNHRWEEGPTSSGSCPSMLGDLPPPPP
eukprot:797134-Amphidinium_carterae.1